MIQRAFGMLHTWQQACRIGMSTNTISQADRNIIWQPPSLGYVKCNIDVAISTYFQKVGMGACLRNATRHFLGAITDVCNAVMITLEVECWGFEKDT